jgi:hypothetical protein
LGDGFGSRGLSLKFEKVSESEADAADQADEKEFATIWPPDVFVAITGAGNIVCHTKRGKFTIDLYAHFVARRNWGPLINTPDYGYLFMRRYQNRIGNGLA